MCAYSLARDEKFSWYDIGTYVLQWRKVKMREKNVIHLYVFAAVCVRYSIGTYLKVEGSIEATRRPNMKVKKKKKLVKRTN